jgi:hypothetical protein
MKNEIRHVGVLGMRWGRRKGKSSGPASKDHETVSVIRKKKVSELSNDEIKIATSRIQLENQYKSLKPSKVARGLKTVDTTLLTMGKVAAAGATITAAVTAGKKIYDLIPKKALAIPYASFN